jgi:hypothetical protein
MPGQSTEKKFGWEGINSGLPESGHCRTIAAWATRDAIAMPMRAELPIRLSVSDAGDGTSPIVDAVLSVLIGGVVLVVFVLAVSAFAPTIASDYQVDASMLAGPM